jgi:diguanylate cyclase (GGDEF)-like protein/PAS domain S-box-containing protein
VGHERLRLAGTSSAVPDGVSAQDLFDASPDGLVVVDRDGIIQAANQSLGDLLGHDPAGLVGQPVEVLLPVHVHARHRRHRADYDRAPQARGMGSGLDLRAQRADGLSIAVDVMLAPIPSAGQGWVLAAVRDVSARRRREQQWEHRALHDPLTGLANRTLTLDRLEHVLAGATRRSSTVGVLFLDLDGFKNINDSHGHAAGDRVLVVVARRLLEHTRHSDTVGRVGGDEFVVVAEDPPSGSRLEQYAERLREAVTAPIRVGVDDVSVGCSLGVVTVRGEMDAVELLAAADRRMYEDKAARRRRAATGVPDVMAAPLRVLSLPE